MFDGERLQRALRERGLSLRQTAEIMGLSEDVLYRKMQDAGDFTRNEIQLLRWGLGLTGAETEDIFFAEELA
ncbi:MAG: XRE family transcriptional regulator [Bacillota bacterium]|nr:XRE family transcriptional regulator [Bacillota bacterium]